MVWYVIDTIAVRDEKNMYSHVVGYYTPLTNY